MAMRPFDYGCGVAGSRLQYGRIAVVCTPGGRSRSSLSFRGAGVSPRARNPFSRDNERAIILLRLILRRPRSGRLEGCRRPGQGLVVRDAAFGGSSP